MSKRVKIVILSVLCGAVQLPLLATTVQAQQSQAAAPPAIPAVAAAPIGSAPALTSITIPAMTPVILEILTDLSSKTNKTGQTFPLRLAVPISIDGTVVVPAGTTGEGEVLDAKRGGMAGSSGILMLIAHDLKVDGRSLRLRSMQVSQVGSDRTFQADVAVALVGVLGMFVTGGNTTIPAGTFAGAKTSDDFTLTLAPEAPVVPAPAATPSVSTKGTTL